MYMSKKYSEKLEKFTCDGVYFAAKVVELHTTTYLKGNPTEVFC